MLKNNKNLVKLLVAILVILFMVIIAFSLVTNSTNNKNVKDISKEELITLMDNIKDNYSISVTKTINGEIRH